MRAAILVLLLALGGCTATDDEPAPAPRSGLVWSNDDGVFVLDGDQPRRLGRYHNEQVAVAADSRSGAVVVSDDFPSSGDDELVIWATGGGEARVPCGRCQGVAIAGDEVRTAEANLIRRFARSDGRFLGSILAHPPRAVSEPIVSPQEVIAATPEVTVLEYVIDEPGRYNAFYAMDANGSVRWEHVVGGTLPVHQYAVDPTGTTLAFSTGTSSVDADMESWPVLLDLATGQVKPLPPLPVGPDALSMVSDLAWNGPNLVVVSTVGPRGDTTRAGDGTSALFERRGDQWDRHAAADTAQLRPLPGGGLARVNNPFKELEITEHGTIRTLSGSGFILGSPTPGDAVPLDWPE
ncbi:hypothetical protein [Actinokineospora globicatena]|uniref:hypothetical protein n=1 Tax=Actinokineospora globicatena TaxID=103729 RepID=UPI0020A5DB87|nr:hypothetical protein [Actinokineospora globicatena]MCP2302970.1 hypothetical protein [Actinokineospora globicatena]GLW79925.1 hypothetical protein Aglo01_44060 [Actinokineospora globicatena]GLW85666.1 hypothetical protein Aglo02_33060 [Actinokineospora globicatena]